MTLTTETITCTGCCREIQVQYLCPHTAPTCLLCCGKHCGAAR